jgi:hypothetical protein
MNKLYSDKAVPQLSEPGRIYRNPTPMTEAEVIAHAKDSVISDFHRVTKYKHDVEDIRSRVTVLHSSSAGTIRTASRRFTVEDTTSLWSPWMMQTSFFGLTVSCGIGACLATYLTFKINQMFFMAVPILGVVSFRSWLAFENVSEEIKYIANQQILRDRRQKAKQAIPGSPEAIQALELLAAAEAAA